MRLESGCGFLISIRGKVVEDCRSARCGLGDQNYPDKGGESEPIALLITHGAIGASTKIQQLEFDAGQFWSVFSRYVGLLDACCSTKAHHQMG